MTVANDLSDLAWVTFDAPPLGMVWVEAWSSAFSDWVRDRLESGRLSDGGAFARDLVATQARSNRDADAFGVSRAAELEPADLDVFADAFLAASVDGFRPRYVAEGEGTARKIRKRRGDEVFQLSPAEGETGADRLLRILAAWKQDQSDAYAAATARTGLYVSDFAHGNSASAYLTSAIEKQRHLATLTSSLSGLKDATQFLRSPAYKALSDAMRPSIALSEQLNTIAQTPGSGILAQIEAQQTRMREITRLAMPGQDLFKGLRLYPDLVPNLADRFDFAGRAASAARAFTFPVPAYDLDKRIGLTSLADQSAFASAISRQFDLRLPAGTLAAISTLTTTSALADQFRLHSFFPPGFQIAAALGLGGTVAVGLAADVLHYYGETTPQAPAFAEALASTTIVDAGELSEEEAVHFLRRVADTLLRLIKAETDIIRRGGLIGVLTFVLAVVSTHIGRESLLVAEHSLTVAQESLVAAGTGPTHADLVALIAETKAAREEARDRIHGDAEAHDRLRYVHDRTPLRAEPQAKGVVLRIVYPDQILRVVDAKGEWIEVEVFDYKSDQPIRGWVSRRRLRLRPLP